MNLIVNAKDISKCYGKTQALTNLNLQIQAGSIYGLIGPNGAGKTTSLAVLAGLIQPSAGAAWILGLQVRAGSHELTSRVGFFSPQFPLFDYLTGLEVLSACGLMHGFARQEVKRRTDDLLELMDLQSAAGQYICQYSQGMRQKIGLACAMIHAPEVLLLDEPFLGLDPSSIYRLVSCFRFLAASGRTIMLSSHNMAIVERLCDRVGILHNGGVQREISLTSDRAETAQLKTVAAAESSLEAALWEVVGTPETKDLAWIKS